MSDPKPPTPSRPPPSARSAEDRAELKRDVLADLQKREYHPNDIADVLLQLSVTFYKAGGISEERVAHFAGIFYRQVEQLANLPKGN